MERARAKVNLGLHVVGRRADGYHLLDTLVAFPDVADVVTVHPAESLGLALSGPGAAALADEAPETNLTIRAARAFAGLSGSTVAVRIGLEKHLPVAAGLGGGSADAAAVLRALAGLAGRDHLTAEMAAVAASLGADVPMCLAGKPARVTGIGERVEALPHGLPPLGIVLVNPRLPVATPAVFRALARRDNPPLPPLPARFDAASLLGYLADCRNDLEDAAVAVAPGIAAVLACLRAAGAARLVRMSGSGATCFALTDDAASAQALAAGLAADQPDWWIAAATLA